MRKGSFYKNGGIVFLCIVLAFFTLVAVKVLFFNEFDCDDGDGADIALNILKGRLVNTFQGNFLGSQSCFLFYPPLSHFFVAVVFKIFGATYLTSKLASIFFALLLAILTCTYCYRRFRPPLGPLISALILFDHLFFSFTYLTRAEMAASFFFSLAVLIFIEADAKRSWKLMLVSGASSGAAMLASYNCNWLFTAFFGYVLYLALIRKDIKSRFKSISAYMVSAFAVMGPWYAWVFMSAQRRSLIFAQVIGQSSSVEGYALAQLVRKLLNPLADLYLATFRYYSPFSIIVFFVLIYFLLNWRKYFYPLILTAASVLMMFFNHRAAHYFVIIMPACYIFFGFLLEDISAGKNFKPAAVKALYAFIIIALATGIFNDLRLTFKRSAIKLDSIYYGDLLKKYTKENSCIATDPVFVLSDYGNRRLVQAALLIWDGFRKSYKDYDEVADKVASADYVVLTERQKRWGEEPVSQSVDFQKYLKERCALEEVIDDGIHGRIWIYRCKGSSS